MNYTIQQPAQTGGRLASVRRLYAYLVSLVSLAAGLSGVSSLVDLLARLWLGTDGQGIYGAGYAPAVASSAGLLLVATPIFLIHWGLAQARQHETDERDSVLRKLFLYAATALSLAGMLLPADLLIEGLAQLAFGAPVNSVELLPAMWLAWSTMAILNAALVAHWHVVLRSDGDFGAEERGGRIVRQLFTVLAGLIGLALLLWGGSSLVRILLTMLIDRMAISTGGAWQAYALAGAVAQVLIGAWLAHANRSQWQEIVQMRPAEGQAALRRVYLYVAVIVGAVATLTPAALVLRELLLMLFSQESAPLTKLFYTMVDPLSFVPVGLNIWLWHWNVIRREADAYGESQESAVVRRLYYYLVAAVGLALLWVGLVELLNAALDALLMAGESTIQPWKEPLANGLSLLVIGAPIWALHWRTVQRVARQGDAAGEAERGSLPRKVYLYGVALIGALIILFQLAQVVYELLLLLMGDPQASILSVQTAHQLAGVVVAAVIWTVHLLDMRGDAEWNRRYEATALPAATIEPERRQALQTRIAYLEAQLAAARTELEQLLPKQE